MLRQLRENMESKLASLAFSHNSSSNAFKKSSTMGCVGESGDDCFMDTTLRLDSRASSFLPVQTGVKRKYSWITHSVNQKLGHPSSHLFGRSASPSDSKLSSGTACTTVTSAKEMDEHSCLELDFSLQIAAEKELGPKKFSSTSTKQIDLHPNVDLELTLSMGPAESEMTSLYSISAPLYAGIHIASAIGSSSNAEEGSISSRWKTGTSLPELHNPPSIDRGLYPNKVSGLTESTIGGPGLSSSTLMMTKSAVTCTSGDKLQRSGTKTCQVEGCQKGARGASGRCISHGGGRRCQKPGCHKGAEGRTVFCKAHGGGRRCEFLGCTKSAEGRTDFCIAHGGGRRCSHDGCTRAARGKSGKCIRHGGGKRCQMVNCTKSAEGLSGLCISHGGGRRCQYADCTKGAQGSTMFCKAHGGGKRCTFIGCTKGAEGSTPFCKGHGGGKRCTFEDAGVICTKSVHGGTNFCVAHGGGKRCAVTGCTKSARGRTPFCVRHGGGKRCKVVGCGKSAQGSTDFCKAHGGGKRCSWGHPGSAYGSEADGPCNSFARGKRGLCVQHSAQTESNGVHEAMLEKRVHGVLQEKRVRGGALVGSVLQTHKVSHDDTDVDVTKNCNAVLLSSGSNDLGFKECDLHGGIIAKHGLFSVPTFVPEGRVHGGSLMAMLIASSASNSKE